MAFGAADLPALLADMGVPVVTTGAPALGLKDETDEEILPDDGSSSSQIGRKTVVTIATGSLSGLTRGAAITVDGVAYKISAVQVVDDGLVTKIEVRK